MSDKNNSIPAPRKRGKNTKNVTENEKQTPKNNDKKQKLSTKEMKEQYEKYKHKVEYQKNYYQKNKDKIKQKYNERKALIKKYEEMQRKEDEENMMKSIENDEDDDYISTDIAYSDVDIDINYSAMCTSENIENIVKPEMIPCYIAGRTTPAFYIPRNVVTSRGNIEVCMTNVYERM